MPLPYAPKPVLRPCRWYDADPQLAFCIQLAYLLPLDFQRRLGEQLQAYLEDRMTKLPPLTIVRRHRWYDIGNPLADALEQLKEAPESIKRQSTHFLRQLLHSEIHDLVDDYVETKSTLAALEPLPLSATS